MRSSRSLFGALVLCLAVFAATAPSLHAQTHGPWAAADSLIAALGVTDQGERGAVAAYYDSVTAVIGQALSARAGFRAKAGGEISAAERDTYLSGQDTRQQRLDAVLVGLRAVLDATTQARFDALPKPRVAVVRHAAGEE